MKNLIFSLVILALFNQTICAQSNSVLLKTDLDGTIMEGSTESLIQAIQNGANIRVGWKMDLNNDSIPDLEHWVPAEFISIIGGHVFNQIQPIFRQMPDWEGPQIKIIQSKMQWTGLVGTNGKLLSRFIIPDIDQFPSMAVRDDLAKQTEVKEMMVWTTWARVE